MKRLRIFNKLFLSHTAIGLGSAIGFYFLFYFILKDALIQRTIDQLSSINTLKENTIENYLSTSQKDLEFLLNHEFFLKQNNYGFDSKGKIEPTRVNRVGKELNSIQQLYNFSCMMITDEQLNAISNTTTDTLYLKYFKQGKLPLKSDIQFQVIDASVVTSSRTTEFLYIMPVELENKLTGFIFIKENFNKIEKLLLETAGMGNTGESYLVGGDFRMRSSSRLFPTKSPLSILVDTEAAKGAFKGEMNNHIIQDYRGIKVLSAYRAINNPALHWALITEIDFSEAMKPVFELRNYLLIIAFIVFGVITVVTFLISNAISKPILYLKDNIVTLSKGIIPENKIAGIGHDEIGQITKAINQLISGLGRTTDFANEIGSGNFDASYTTLGDHDTLGQALISMRNRLKALNEREARLVREKAAALLEGQENERKRIIRELHDGVGQLLTAIRLKIEALEIEGSASREIEALINETIDEVRRISYNVMPNVIVDFGLRAALKGLCENVKKYSGLQIDFHYIKEIEQKLNFEISITVFRIAQEGLNNIVKHAKATQVSLDVLEKEDEVYFILKDDGNGFEEKTIQNKTGFGLRSIKERAMLRGGSAEIHSTLGEGTVVDVHIPIS